MKLSRLIIILSAIALHLPPSATAGEFGNIFIPDVEEDSRAASAQALEGIEKIFAALRQRELRQIQDGSTSLGAAAKSLKMASGMMEKIEIPPDSDRNISWANIPSRDRRVVDFVMKTLGRKRPEKLSGLYKAFAKSTARLGDLLEVLVKERKAQSAEPIMPGLSNEIALYIQFGDVVSKIARL